MAAPRASPILTTGAGSICNPAGVAVDGAGNLYVADTVNNRVLEYSNPFAACANTFPCVGGPAGRIHGVEPLPRLTQELLDALGQEGEHLGRFAWRPGGRLLEPLLRGADRLGRLEH